MEDKNLLIQECKKGEELYRCIQEQEENISKLEEDVVRIQKNLEKVQNLSKEIDEQCRYVEMLIAIHSVYQTPELELEIAKRTDNIHSREEECEKAAKLYREALKESIFLKEKRDYYQQLKKEAIGRFKEYTKSLFERIEPVKDLQIEMLESQIDQIGLELEMLDMKLEEFYNQAFATVDHAGINQIQQKRKQRTGLEKEMLRNMVEVIRRAKLLLSLY